MPSLADSSGQRRRGNVPAGSLFGQWPRGTSTSRGPRRRGKGPRLDHLVVLVLEDHPDIRDLLRRMLEGLGARVRVAEDGLAGLRALQRVKPDAIVADLLMPRMDGVAFARRVRRNPRWANVPILAATALGDDAHYLETWASGFDAHLTKPIEQEVLARALQAAVRRRRG